ncbi:hypothetical protein [Nocardioides sp. SYSU DS0663]|uniref:hypothetical protein n=1 Tax=Nocardioides sp. SYSU DS0663 TaxID=3416445 RepID=UPI003F4BAB82
MVDEGRDELADRPEESIEQVEAERQERLDPANRPDDVEVDNTGRDFDVEKGMFTDSEEYDAAPRRYLPPEEAPA